jgi:hypothetical protein
MLSISFQIIHLFFLQKNKNVVEACITLLTRDLKRNLFILFASWSGNFAKPLGIVYHAGGTNNADDEKLQFSALQVLMEVII